MQNPTVLPSEASGPYTACVWYTGLYIARSFYPHVPGTKAEMLALAALGGKPNGESGNFTLLAAAMKARYGLIGKVYEGAAAARPAVLAAAQAGPHVMGLAGDGYNLSPRYQSNHFGHAIAVQYPGGTTGKQLDPLAPAGYPGDAFGPTELSAFATAAIIFKEEASMSPVILRPVKQQWLTGIGDSTPGGQFFRGGPGLGQMKHFNQQVTVTSIAEDAVLVNGVLSSGSWRIILYNGELLWMHRSNLTPVPNTRVPATGFGLSFESGFTQEQVNAKIAEAVNPLNTRIAGIKTKVSSAKAEAVKIAAIADDISND